jgi:hypothetical protein
VLIDQSTRTDLHLAASIGKLYQPNRVDELLLHALVAGNFNGNVHEIVQLLLQAVGAFPSLQPGLGLRQVFKRNLRGPEFSLAAAAATAAIPLAAIGRGDGGPAAAIGRQFSLAFLVDG